MTRTRIGVFFLGVLIFVLAFLGLGNSTPSDQITITKSQFPVWDLFEYSIEKNSKVKFVHSLSYHNIFVNYQSGAVDGALSTIYEAILAQAKGTPVKIISLLDYTDGADMVIASQNVSELIDLKSRRIGAEFGTISHYTAIKALEKAGLSTDQVTFVFKPMNELIDAFKYGHIDAISTFEPFATTLLTNTTAKPIFTSQDIPRKICDVFYINPTKVALDDSLLVSIKKSWHKTTRQFIKSPDKINKKMSQFYSRKRMSFQFSMDGIKLIQAREDSIALSSNGYLIDSLEEMMQFMLEHQVIDEPVDVHNMISTNDSIH